MKTLLSSILILLAVQVQAQSALDNKSKDCNPMYSLNSKNLAVEVDTMEDDFVTLGYFISGEFVGIKVKGCMKLSFEHPRILCDGRQIGTSTKLTVPEYGPPSGRMTLLNNVSAEVTGSCDVEKRDPLTLVIK
jgi:hypothetical protein